MLDTYGKFNNESVKVYRVREDRIGSTRSDFQENDEVVVQELSPSKPIDPNGWIKAKIVGLEDFFKAKRSVFVFEQV